jgi:hypothetical protein
MGGHLGGNSEGMREGKVHNNDILRVFRKLYCAAEAYVYTTGETIKMNATFDHADCLI